MPLPVVLISTISKDGVHNAAPWSCVTPVLRPLDEVLIASWLKRDTLENIRQTGEFVINVPPAGMEEAVMICARNFPPEVDELEKAGLQPRPSSEGQATRHRGLPGLGGVRCRGGDCQGEVRAHHRQGGAPGGRRPVLLRSRMEWTMREQSPSAPWAGRMGCNLSVPSPRERATNMHPC